VPAGNVSVPEEPATAGIAIVCAALAFDDTALDDVAQLGAAHDDAGVDVGDGVATGTDAPLLPPPPHAASNKTSPSAEAGTR
jgi:hypothetical protein